MQYGRIQAELREMLIKKGKSITLEELTANLLVKM